MFSTLLFAVDDSQGNNIGSIELRSGVIVDLKNGRVFLMQPGNSIEAVNIADGKTLWKSTNAAKPLSFSNGILVSQIDKPKSENNLNLAVLDVEREGNQVSTISIPLPQQVNVMVDEGISARFFVNAVPRGDDSFIFWKYQDIPMRGMLTVEATDPNKLPTPANLVPQQSEGTIKVNLRTGEATEIKPRAIPTGVIEAIPMNLTSLPDIIAEPNQRLSIDGRYTLKSKRIADDRTWEKYEWTIVNSESNEEVGKLKSHLSQSTFVVIDSLIIFETGAYIRRTQSGMVDEPLMVRAVDLKTGKRLWARPVRDTKYRGTLPP
jgi:hypothetical protein